MGWTRDYIVEYMHSFGRCLLRTIINVFFFIRSFSLPPLPYIIKDVFEFLASTLNRPVVLGRIGENVPADDFVGIEQPTVVIRNILPTVVLEQKQLRRPAAIGRKRLADRDGDKRFCRTLSQCPAEDILGQT